MAAKDSVIKQLNKVFVLYDTPAGGGSTTLTAATAVGATALAVAGITSFAAGQRIRIGSGETMESADILSASVLTITVAQGLAYTHNNADPVVGQTAYDLGHIEAGGVKVNFAGPSVDILVSTQRLLFTTLYGFINADIDFILPAFTLPFFAVATGQLQTRVLGAGTTLSPTQITTNGSEFAGVSNACIVAVGTRFDGTYIRAELWGVDFNYTGISFALTRGALVGIPVKGMAAAGGAFFTSNYGFTPDTSLTPTNAKVWDALTEVGVMVDTATNTTTTASAAAGAITLVVASATGITAGVWLRVGTGNTAQFLWVDSVATLTLTLRTVIYATIANGAVVTVVTPTKFAGTSPAGVTVAIAGTFAALNIAERRLSIGGRPGDATVTMSFGTIEISLANLAYALGIAQSQIAGGRLPVNNNIAGTGLDGVYLKGTLKDGTTAWVIAAGSNMDVSKFTMAINNAGPAATIPIAVKPTSSLTFLCHP